MSRHGRGRPAGGRHGAASDGVEDGTARDAMDVSRREDIVTEESLIAPGGATGNPASRPSRRGAVFIMAILAGWGVALAVSAPLTGAPERAVATLTLATAGAWWVAVVVVILSDLRDYIIPDGASLAIAGLGLVQAAAVPLLVGEGWSEAALADTSASWTGIVAFALFWLVGHLFHRFGTRDALGFGDVKLAGASAVWLAPADAAVALEIAALGAVLALLAAHARKSDGVSFRNTAVPFGAFLAPAAWVVFVVGPAVRDTAGLASW